MVHNACRTLQRRRWVSLVIALLVFLVFVHTNIFITLDLVSNAEVSDDLVSTLDIQQNRTLKDEKAVFQHSAKWLVGPRMSNAEVSDDLVSTLILDTSPLNFASASEVILSQQSVCPADSKFLHWQAQNEKDDVKIEDSLVIRLMYLAIHEHQHMPARAEALTRLKNTTNILRNITDKVGNFDYECDPDTKYIVNSIPGGNGFGFVFRRHGIEPLMLGLLTDRVSLSMHLKKEEPGPKALRTQFTLSECERGDMQCLFMPLSPCVLTYKDMENAVELPRDKLDELRTTGVLNETYAKERVLVITSENHHLTPEGVRQAFVDKITSLYDVAIRNLSDGGSSSKPWNMDEASLQKVKDRILNEKSYMAWTAFMLYGLRPNQSLRGKVNEVIQKSIPHDFDRNLAIGIPIRAGDKCNSEMHCLEFDQYMQMAHEMALKRTKQRQNPTSLAYPRTLTNYSKNMYNTIVLSSDSKSMITARFKYKKNSTFPYEFIANDDDIGQGNGRPKEHKSLGISDDVMIATLSAFKMQMMPETLITNMCSNSHKLMSGFYHGCGRPEVGYTEDQNDNDNDMFAYTCKIHVGKKRPKKK